MLSGDLVKIARAMLCRPDAGPQLRPTSGGQQQRLQLAMGLVADPVLLVLDEPTEGLDVEARRRFWNTLRRRLDDGAGVLITTNLVDEAAAVADRVVVVDRGRVVAEGTPDELRKTLPTVGSKSPAIA